MRNVSALCIFALVGIAGCAENPNKAPQTATNTTGDVQQTPYTTSAPLARDEEQTRHNPMPPPRTDVIDGTPGDHRTGAMGDMRTGAPGDTRATPMPRSDAPRADTAMDTTPPPPPSTGAAPTTTDTSGQPARADATNTGRNERDRNGKGLVPTDQGGSEADRTVTQKVRQAIVGDGSLSFTAKNVKIITIDGKVTLRGPVKNAQERTTIEQKAKSTPGVKDVVNQIEVKTD